ncbi:winged helix-turn-helix transcriptional regulator [Bradyrhizobium liaoningense]|uniref:winged helix-turn-helix transcriptional regulator n=1 Tax=Bradyrhizobium liaoningense TaxID=43992 RepID=UPI001BAE30BC|nr:helix-turn-helix domain-containing protein [Bradyrhizobium liaoningense]MBR0983418.1 helix-turn-helix transcriptional regulator [Bradyrhizobium liaoningense]
MGTSLKPENTDLPAPPRPTARSDARPDPIPDPNHADCRGVASVLSRVGDKWSVFVIMMLGDGPKRFNELKRMINGISQRMLTLTLRGLERDGLVTRTIFPTIPPRVDYELTDLGRGLQQPVKALGQWAIDHLMQIEAARTKFDQRNDG